MKPRAWPMFWPILIDCKIIESDEEWMMSERFGQLMRYISIFSGFTWFAVTGLFTLADLVADDAADGNAANRAGRATPAQHRAADGAGSSALT